MSFLQSDAPKQRISCNFTWKSPFWDKHKVLFRVDIVISVYIVLNINMGYTKKSSVYVSHSYSEIKWSKDSS